MAADHADRLAHDERVADLLLEREVVEDLLVAGDVAGRQAGLDHVGPHERHADLVGDDLGDLLAAGGQALGDGLHVLAPLLAGVKPHVSKAALAAATARSTSAACPSGIAAA